MIPQVRVTRYVTPLREGGSLPGIVEGDDLGTWVCKFRGAGQGIRVLAAEVLVTGLCRHLELPTPELAVLDLDPEIARYEADEEVQDLLTASVGLNLGIDFLPGAFGFDGREALGPEGEELALRTLWLDAFIANVDRSWRNPNLLVWHGRLWLIDHGASLYFHHAWAGGLTDPARFARQPWSADDHVFGDLVPRLGEVDAALRDRLRGAAIEQVVADVPDDWLAGVPDTEPEQVREAYAAFLRARLDSSDWLPEAAR
ncbi:hypothetical protein K8W59_07110 [Nocardioides rotundus]|uniref:HipA family kinase n=1 Tax=Nocardioides rotundus TaxID=1774216 RepID=UPI001CBC5E04|nr:HipA family kinase [Nocardioides rotundus]UAL31224.1 hypothetical protein K8W59_07110 [Nocardioides rotundus]